MSSLAETVRRFSERDHVHYGDTQAYYQRVPCAQVVRRYWTQHLDGSIDADEAVDRIVEEGLADN